MTKKRIVIAADHGGYELKEKLVPWLKKEGYKVEDLGTDSKKSVDWPLYAFKAATKIASGEYKEGILICTSGIGMSIAANRIPRVRASLCYNEEIAKHTREHNASNVICLGAGYLSEARAKKILKAWLNTKHSVKARYKRRNFMVDELAMPKCPGCF
jgi:ribose 5-phosphate isomerase B